MEQDLDRALQDVVPQAKPEPEAAKHPLVRAIGQATAAARRRPHEGYQGVM